jgi:hypothetical protein
MATVVLTAVGSIFGGPVGAAIGYIAGQQIDKVIFAPKGRQGPRLGDLSVQTSRYGSAIPKLYGAVRVSGTVIWSTDLIEARATQSSGKGQPKNSSYSYSASFAVALSARRVGRVGRIWADGNLLRGTAGDFKTATTFRFLNGDEDQAIDPLIAAAEGLTMTPAYRGCAVAVFEDFQLADYGNRIPTLSFELFADEGPVSAAQVIGDLSAGAVAGTSAALLDGIAVTGDSVRGVAATLTAALPLSLRDDGTVLRVAAPGIARLLQPDEMRIIGTQSRESRRAATAVPETLALAYYDPARDYQPGVQRARRSGGSRREDRIDLPATIATATAKTIIETRLSGLWRERRSLSIALLWNAIDLRPGDAVKIAGGSDGDVWRVATTTFEGMAVKAELVPVAAPAPSTRVAEPGRSVAQTDRVQGATTLMLIDLPPLSDTADTAPRVVIAANGALRGWRSAALLASGDGGASYEPIGDTAVPATIGRTVTLLKSGSARLIDRTNNVDVTLANDALILNDADDDALLAGANLAMIGRECVQFARALPLGANRWRLSGLWRGRRGTEVWIDSHTADDPFVLIEAAALMPVPPRFAVDGLRILAAGVGDGVGPDGVGPDGVGPDGVGMAALLPVAGMAITPLSPVALGLVPNGGATLLRWVRRSREGWRWDDAVDVPLAEERALYRVTRTGAGLVPIEQDVAPTEWTYTAAQRAADVAAGATRVTFAVAQIGSRRVSPAATITLLLN